MKFVLASMSHETNSFSPLPTRLADFFSRYAGAGPDPDALLCGERAIAQVRGTNSSMAGMLATAEAAGAQVEVPLFASAWPSGPVDAASFERMCDAIVAAVRRGCDGVLLALHGAMVAQGCDDPESELARRVRSVAPGIPLAVALDFHANIGRTLVDNADVITGYRTFPHVDMAETGERATRTLLSMLRGECRPVMSFEWLPMLPHTANCTPSRPPMKPIMDRAIAAEASGEVLNASVFGGFPLSDCPEAGLSVLVVGRDAASARRLGRELAQAAWRSRADFVFEPEPMLQTLERAARLDGGPVVLADHGNNAGAGGTCDSMQVLKAMLERGMSGIVAGLVCDPQAVAQLAEAGAGAEVELDVGGRWDMSAAGCPAEPLRLRGTVRAITDGRFTVTGPMMTGMVMNIGRTVAFDTGAAQLVISERRMEPVDTGIFTHCGIDPRRARYVLIGSRQHFRAGFEPIARHILLVAGPGVCRSEMSAFRYQRLRRPMYPLDPDAQWTPAP